MSLGLAAQLDQARTVVAGLTPATASQTDAFAAADAMLQTDAAPPVMERLFDVSPSDSPPVMTDEMSPDNAQFLGRFVVKLKYDAMLDRDAASSRMSEDSEQIVIALESTANYAANVQRVTFKAGATTKDGDFWTRTLTFECLFRRSLTI